MKYVKLIARPNTWFKSGTEVFDYNEKKRVSLTEYQEASNWGMIDVRGTRVCESLREGHEIGEEREDGETCFLGEFDVEIVDEPN